MCRLDTDSTRLSCSQSALPETTMCFQWVSPLGLSFLLKPWVLTLLSHPDPHSLCSPTSSLPLKATVPLMTMMQNDFQNKIDFRKNKGELLLWKQSRPRGWQRRHRHVVKEAQGLYELESTSFLSSCDVLSVLECQRQGRGHVMPGSPGCFRGTSKVKVIFAFPGSGNSVHSRFPGRVCCELSDVGFWGSCSWSQNPQIDKRSG